MSDALENAERAVEAYGRPFLADREEPWAVSARTRLRERLARVLADLVRHPGTGECAAALAARAARADPALHDGEAPPSRRASDVWHGSPS